MKKEIIGSLLSGTGITLNGNNPYDPQIHNEHFYNRVLRHGSLGLGESYMEGWWDCEELDEFFNRILSAELDNRIKHNWSLLFEFAWQTLLNAGRRSKAFEIGKRHYDLGNDLYRAMLDKSMTYTCGYWKDAKDLAEAQQAKMDLICRKINLKAGEKLLDIGSGWGNMMAYAVKKYGVSAVGISVSKEQKELTDEMYKGLPIETRLQDYRDINGRFDKAISLGMFEHVGYKNYRAFMEVVHKSLNYGGIFLLHTIGGNHSGKGLDPWIEKYIFPNSMLPSIKQIGQSIEGLFVMEDWHSFGAYYDKTLMAWHQNFEANWDKLKANYDEKFHRMWRYYLLACAGSFRARKNQLWQVVLSKGGVRGGYVSIR